MKHSTEFPDSEYSHDDALTFMIATLQTSQTAQLRFLFRYIPLPGLILIFVPNGYVRLIAAIAIVAMFILAILKIVSFSKRQEQIALHCPKCQSPLKHGIHQSREFFSCSTCKTYGKGRSFD